METVPLHTALIHPSPPIKSHQRGVKQSLQLLTSLPFTNTKKGKKNTIITILFIYPFAVRWRQSGTNKGSASGVGG